VSDPLCHPRDTAPRFRSRGSLTPRCMSLSSSRTALCRAIAESRRSVSKAVSTAVAPTENASVRFFRKTAFI
jgi:hypothetical protein